MSGRYSPEPAPAPEWKSNMRSRWAIVVAGFAAVLSISGCGRPAESADPVSHVPTRAGDVAERTVPERDNPNPAANPGTNPEATADPILAYLETGEDPEEVEVGVAPLADRIDADENGAGTELTWDDLYTLDIETGTAPPSLTALDGQPVRIPGFMVPLDDAAETVAEFLLVPFAGACIHVPPPPPNQIVHVTMTGDATSRVYWWDPIWIHGVLRIESIEHAYGQAAFTLEGTRTEVYSSDS